MPESYVQMPPDSTGKKTRTRQRVVGANTIEEPYMLIQSERVLSGVYHATPGGALVIQAAAQAATAGFWWLFNPVGSAVLVALRRIGFQSQLGSALAAPTSPRISLELLTATGTPTAAIVAAARARSTYPALPTAKLLTATTGLTITAGASFRSFLPIASATAVGYTATSEDDYFPDESQQIILAAGEGIVCRQPDVGTTGDTRRFLTNIIWDEFTLP